VSDGAVSDVPVSGGAVSTEDAGRAAGVAALCAALLAVSKLAIFLFTGSMIVALSAWDSALDVLVSALNRRVILFARSAPDDEHPYGHGKAESMAGLAQGALIMGGALLIAVSSGQELWGALTARGASAPTSGPLVALFFALAAAASWLITRALRAASARHKSPALAADAEHYQTDVLSNAASALSVGLIWWTQRAWLDPLLAILFGVLVARGGLGLIREAVDDLLDHDLPDAEKAEALALIRACSPHILDVHRFRGRRSGHRLLFDLHVTLPRALTFSEAHDITDAIELALSERFDADVVVHADPSAR
jgi:ferrous-iron efflux pump FieF